MKFIYKAKKGIDQSFQGRIEADNREEALNKLVAQGLFPVSITEEVVVKDKHRQELKREKKVKRRITSGEILAFTRKLTTLIRAKVELLSSLKIIYEQTENVKLQEVILEIYNATKEGKTFSDSLSRFPDFFSVLYVNIIKAGEASGRLDLALDHISEFLSREESLKNKVWVALAYPTVLLFVGSSSIFVLINFVIPKLKPMFIGLGKQLPLITKIILEISTWSNRVWWMIFGFIIVVFFILYTRKGSSFFVPFWKKILNSIPILKRLLRNQELSHFSRALALLLKSGVPALNSLKIATPGIQDKKLREGLNNAWEKIAAGETLSSSMGTFTGLPVFFIKMIAVGEESGRLTEVLEEISYSYTQQVEMDIALITSLLEPILILVMGIILGSIVLSILLPTFQITQIVR